MGPLGVWKVLGLIQMYPSEKPLGPLGQNWAHSGRLEWCLQKMRHLPCKPRCEEGVGALSGMWLPTANHTHAWAALGACPYGVLFQMKSCRVSLTWSPHWSAVSTTPPSWGGVMVEVPCENTSHTIEGLSTCPLVISRSPLYAESPCSDGGEWVHKASCEPREGDVIHMVAQVGMAGLL